MHQDSLNMGLLWIGYFNLTNKYTSFICIFNYMRSLVYIVNWLTYNGSRSKECFCLLVLLTSENLNVIIHSLPVLYVFQYRLTAFRKRLKYFQMYILISIHLYLHDEIHSCYNLTFKRYSFVRGQWIIFLFCHFAFDLIDQGLGITICRLCIWPTSMYDVDTQTDLDTVYNDQS